MPASEPRHTKSSSRSIPTTSPPSPTPNGSFRRTISHAHDNAKALEWGDKALETFPNDLDIVVSDANVAMAMKDNGKIVDYAVKGAAVCQSIAATAEARGK